MLTTLGELAKRGELEFSDGYRTKGSEYAPSGYRIIRAGDVIGSCIDFSGPDFVSSTRRQAIGSKAVRPGDVVLTTKGTVGRTARVRGVPEPAVYSPQLCYFRPTTVRIDSGYLFHWFSSPEFVHQSTSMKSSTDMAPYISLSQLAGTRITLPPLPEQQAIAEVLGALDDKIAANRALVTSSVQLTESLFTRTTQGLVLAPLSSIAIVNGDTIKPRAGDLRYIDIAAVSTDDYASPTPRSWANAPSRARRRVHHGDTLWSTVRPNRRARALVLEDDPTLVASTGLVTLSPRHQGFSFLHEATRTGAFADYLVANAEGSAYPAVTASKFDRAPVPAADADTIVAFNRLTDPLWERVGSARAEITTLASLRDTLLPALMDGTLRVKDAARVASEVV